MDELLAAMVKVYECLDDFNGQLCSTREVLQNEVDLMRKESILNKDAEALERDISALEDFHSCTALQLREYLDQKITILKTYLYE